MAGLKDHPIAERIRLNPPAPPASLSLEALKALVMECGADDCGIVSLDDPLMPAEERAPYLEGRDAEAQKRPPAYEGR